MTLKRHWARLLRQAFDQSSQRRARDAEIRALEHGRTGTPVTWRNGRLRGEVVPGQSFGAHIPDVDEPALFEGLEIELDTPEA